MDICEKTRWAKKVFFHRQVLPEQITFFVTNKCNLRCKHCFYWENLNSSGSEFSLRELEKIVPTIGEFSFLSLTGGEPFLRDDLAEIVKLFIEKNKVMRISIPTNGFLTEKIVNLTKRMLKISERAKIFVKVSLDGIGEEHDSIRGVKGSFEKAVRTFTLLEDLKQEYSNFKLGILLTLSKLNEYELWNTYKNVKENLSPDIVGLNFVRGTPRIPSLKEVDLCNYQKLYSYILQDLLKDKHYEFYSAYKSRISEFICKIVKKKEYPLKCYAGRLSVVVDSSLDVFPCENLDKKMGNLRDYNYNFRNLWFSRNSSMIRDYITNNGCWCTCECNLQINCFFNVRQLLPMITKTVGHYGNRLTIFGSCNPKVAEKLSPEKRSDKIGASTGSQSIGENL